MKKLLLLLVSAAALCRANTVIINWPAPSAIGTPGNTGYTVWWTTNWNLCYSNQSLYVGTNRSVTNPVAFVPGSTWNYFVTCTDSNGVGNFSLCRPITTNLLSVSPSAIATSTITLVP